MCLFHRKETNTDTCMVFIANCWIQYLDATENINGVSSRQRGIQCRLTEGAANLHDAMGQFLNKKDPCFINDTGVKDKK